MAETTANPGSRRGDPAHQAFQLLRWAFTVLPIAAGADKFTNLLTEWSTYLAPAVDRMLPGSAAAAMMAFGGVEILAGMIVLVRPRFGGLLVAGWLAGVVANLLLVPGFYDVALRDAGLMVGALALARLAGEYDHQSSLSTSVRIGERRA